MKAMAAERTARYELLENEQELVVGGEPADLGGCVFNERYRIPVNTVYYARIMDPHKNGYFYDKVLLLKVYEEDTSFLFIHTSRTLVVYMDRNGVERTASIEDIFYLK